MMRKTSLTKMFGMMMLVFFSCAVFAWSGSGTENDPYQISTADDLITLGKQVNNGKSYDGVHFKLTQDIDLSGIANFTPIGTDTEALLSVFCGTFDGDSKIISNLTINSQNLTPVGLFGNVGDNANFQNIFLKDVDITGNYLTGSLIGDMNNTMSGWISNCHVTGKVEGISMTGGLIGGCRGDVTVSNCSSTATVTGDWIVGGLIGASENSTYSDCYATGIVAGNDAECIGGFIGQSEMDTCSNIYASGNVSGSVGVGGIAGSANSTYSDCYATGDVSGEESIGGFIGRSAISTYSDCYATGDVSGEEAIGGFIGQGEMDTYSNIYASGNVSGSVIVGAFVGLSVMNTYSNIYASSNVSGKDGVGGIAGGSTNSTYSDCYATGDVSGEEAIGGFIGRCLADTYINIYAVGKVTGDLSIGGLIGSVEEESLFTNCYYDRETTGQTGEGTGLSTAEMAMNQNFIDTLNNGRNVWKSVNSTGQNDGYPILMWQKIQNEFEAGSGSKDDPYQISTADDLITLGKQVNNGKSYDDVYFKLTQDIDLSGIANFTPIGTDTNPFCGVFDGDSKIISNLTINNNANSYIGFFGYITDTVIIQNLFLENMNITGAYYVGGLAGYMHSKNTISNCHVTGEIAGKGYTGGLIGMAKEGSFSDCDFSGTISGDQTGGGLVGNFLYGTIIRSHTTGKVIGRSSVGGFIGAGLSGTYTDCYSTADVESTYGYLNSGGGLIGYNYASTISNCYATGNVSGSEDIGGLSGYLQGGTVSNCYATGNVSGLKSVGGMFGYIDLSGKAVNCFSIGEVTNIGTQTTVGGFVGEINGKTSTNNCYWNTVTSKQATGVGSADSDFIIGKTTAEMTDSFGFVQTLGDLSESPFKYKPGSYPQLYFQFTDRVNVTVTLDQTPYTYNAAAQSPTVVNAVSADNVTFPKDAFVRYTTKTVPEKFISKPVNAGDYTFRLYEKYPHYLFSIDTAPFTIATAPVTFTAQAQTLRAGDSFVPNKQVVNLVANESTTVTEKTDYNPQTSQEGAYTITPRPAWDNAKAANYGVTIDTAILTVTPSRFQLTVQNGTGSGSYAKDEKVTITETLPNNKIFTGWRSSNGGTFANPSAQTTIFTMPENTVTVTATSRDKLPTATPIFSVASGDFQKTFAVTLSAGTNAEIHYSLTSSDPKDFIPYTSAITIPARTTTTIHAIAYEQDCLASTIATVTYTYAPYAPIFVIADTEKVYNANAQFPTVTSTNAEHFTVKYNTDSCINADSYQILVSVDEEGLEVVTDSFIGNFFILKAPQTLSLDPILISGNPPLAPVTLNAQTNQTEGGTWTYISSDPEILSVNDNIATPLKDGTTTLHALHSGNQNYLADTVSVSAQIATIRYNLTVQNGTGSGTYTMGDTVTLTTTLTNDRVFTGWISSNGGTFDNPNTENTIFTMPDSHVTITATSRDKLQTASPIFSVASGDFQKTFTVTLTADPNAEIHYSLTSSDPKDFTPYTGAITIPARTTTTIHAIAYEQDCFESTMATVTYTYAPYAPIFVIADTEKVYNANAQFPTVTSTNAEHFTVKYDTDSCINADSYQILVSVNEEGLDVVTDSFIGNFFIRKAPQKLSLDPIIVSGNPPFAPVSLDAQTNQTEGGTWTYISSDPEVLSVNDNIATPLKDGVTLLHALHSGNQNYLADTVSVSVQIAATRYQLTLEYGNGSGSYAMGDRVTIKEALPEGKRFIGWISSNGGTFDDPTAGITVFTMPDTHVIVTAQFTIQHSAFGSTVQVSSEDFNLKPGTLTKKTKLIAEYTDPYNKKLKKMNVKMNPDGETFSVKGNLKVIHLKKYKLRRKTEFTRDILEADRELQEIQKEFVPVSVNVNLGKGNRSDSEIVFTMAAAKIDSAILVPVQTPGGKTVNYVVIVGSNFGTKQKGSIEYKVGGNIKRFSAPCQKKPAKYPEAVKAVLPEAGNSVVFKLPSKYNTLMWRRDFVLDNGNGVAAITLEK